MSISFLAIARDGHNSQLPLGGDAFGTLDAPKLGSHEEPLPDVGVDDPKLCSQPEAPTAVLGTRPAAAEPPMPFAKFPAAALPAPFASCPAAAVPTPMARLPAVALPTPLASFPAAREPAPFARAAPPAPFSKGPAAAPSSAGSYPSLSTASMTRTASTTPDTFSVGTELRERLP